MNSNNSNKKSRKVIFITILFLIFLSVTTYIGYSYYKKKVVSENLKSELIKGASNNDFAFFLKNELLDSIETKLKNDNYENSIDMIMATTMQNNMFSDLDLSKFQMIFHTVHENENKKSYHRLQTKYSGNDLLTIDFIRNSNQFALKSDEIVNKYVGVKSSNFQDIINKVKNTQVDLSNFKKLKNYVLNRETIDSSKLYQGERWTKYADIMQKQITANNISLKDNVVITMDSEQIQAKEYTITLNNSQVKSMLQEISNELEKDDELFSELVVSNVENFENEESEILEYTDNDTTKEIPAEENNYNTSLQIWDDNTTTNTDTEDEQILNTVPANTVTESETTNTTELINTTQEETEINSTDGQENTTQNSTTELSPIDSQQNQESPHVEEVQQPSEENRTNVVNEIDEDENLRTQGYIAINEDQEKSEEEAEDESFIIGENYEETLKNIDELIAKINWKSYLLTGAKANSTSEELKEEIQNRIKKKINQNNSLVAKLYISEGKLIRVDLEMPEVQENWNFEIFSKENKEKYLNIRHLVGEEKKANGYSISLYKKNSDASVKYKISINKIFKNKINKKTIIDSQIKGTSNSKKYDIGVDIAYSDSDGEFKVNLKDVLNFDTTAQIDDLTEENCLFLDNLSDEELLVNVTAIKEKMMDVLKEKNRNLNIIDINNSNLIVKQNQEDNAISVDETAKLEAKNILIQTISNKMKEYLNDGNNLKLEDLNDLQIPSYEVNVSITPNLAIITVNGYTFKLDSDFNLSDS